MIDDSFTSQAKEEVKALLSKSPLQSEDVSRLFKLFLQREDMRYFVQDFGNLEEALGLNANDRFNWSQFSMVTYEENDSLEAQLKTEQKQSLLMSGKISASASADDEDDSKKKKKKKKMIDIDFTEEDGEKEGAEDDDADDVKESEESDDIRVLTAEERLALENDFSKDYEALNDGEDFDDGFTERKKDFEREINSSMGKEDYEILQDKNGRLWSGTILDTDTVQKVMYVYRI